MTLTMTFVNEGEILSHVNVYYIVCILLLTIIRIIIQGYYK